MILPLSENYRITSDEYNFILQRKTDPKKAKVKRTKTKIGVDGWSNIGFWADLGQLMSSYTREVLRKEIGETTLKKLSLDLRSLKLATERIGEQCETMWEKTR